MRKPFLLIFFIPCLASAQTDSSFLQKEQLRLTNSGIEQDIYNGQEHSGYLPAIERNAYYLNSDWQPGNLVYRDIFYPSVFLKYDLIKDELVIRHANGYTGISLFTPRIQRFSMSGKNFVRCTENDPLGLPPGIYEEEAKGNISFYIRHIKKVEENVTTGGIERNVVAADAYYLVKNKVATLIKKEKNIWDLVRDRKNEIKNDLKQKGLSFKHNPEATLTEIVTYYNDAIN